MKKLFYLCYFALCILCLWYFLGCASTLQYNAESKTINAKDYTITFDPKTGVIKAAPNRWFTTKAISDLFGNLLPIVESVIGK